MRKLALLTMTAFFLLGNMHAPQWKPYQIEASDLVGVWQADDSLLTAGWRDAYCFFPNGTFDFHVSQYNSLGRILSLHGHYRLAHDTLCTQVDSRTEMVGGKVIRGNTETTGGWEIAGYVLKVIKQPSKWESTFIGLCSLRQGSQACMSLEGRKYYRISGDPRYYQ